MACVPGSEADVLPAWKQDLGQQQKEAVPVTTEALNESQWNTDNPFKADSILNTVKFLRHYTPELTMIQLKLTHLTTCVAPVFYSTHFEGDYTMKCGIKQHPHDTVYLPNAAPPEWTVTSLQRRLLEDTFSKRFVLPRVLTLADSYPVRVARGVLGRCC